MAKEPKRSRKGHMRPRDRFLDRHRELFITVAIAGGAVLGAAVIAKLLLPLFG